MGRLAVVVAWFSLGCLADPTVPCGELSCPAGSVCTPGGCATPSEIAACAGQTEGGPCTGNLGANGYCVGGACHVSVCGNGIVEPGEACDDGNHLDGDGCNSTCTSNETCGNSIVDYDVGEQCDDGNNDNFDSCRNDCTIPRCGDGIVDVQNGEACDDGASNSDAPGAACRTNCQPQRCGDGVLDPGEVCDDGNVVSGDGCSGDCKSNETCGNGYLDAVKGEQCDFGAGLSADGCSSVCTIEFPIWSQVTFDPLVGRRAPMIAFDSVRKRDVMFGGRVALPFTDTPVNDTWEWNGVDWIERAPLHAPSPRSAGMIAYDPSRGRTVLFGSGYGAITNDTWEWDGFDWHEVTTAHAPSPRQSTAMAYDPVSSHVLLFGGQDLTLGVVADTWSYDGVDWTQLAPAHVPPARSDHALATDVTNNDVVLFGGFEGASDPGNGFAVGANDTWVWNGSDWIAQTPVHSPSVRFKAGFAPDSATGKVVLLDGFNDGALITETWEWTGADWQQESPAQSPPQDLYYGIAEAPSTAGTIVFGGDGTTGFHNDTWSWNGTTWTSVATGAKTSPTSNVGSAIYVDPFTGRAYLIQIGSSGGTAMWSWDWNDATWQALAPGPAPQSFGGLAFDAAREKAVTFNYTSSWHTWEWDGSVWTDVASAHAPPFRQEAALIYDPNTATTLLFGGQTAPRSALADTWSWNGTDWTQLAPAMSPAARTSPAVAVDLARSKIVLFGGANPFGDSFGDTWEWDGTTWTQLTPAVSPPPRQGAAASFDAVRGHVVLFGGVDAPTATPFADTWEWDGTTWVERTPVNSPPVASSYAMAYDAARDATVMLGAGIWTYAWRSTTPPDRCIAGDDTDGDGLAGCADPDCWARCTPLCPPNAPCTPEPSCGDGVCSVLEGHALCPSDCP